MALTAYQTQTRNLLQNPAAPTTLYDTTSINLWINTARGQLAGDAECIRLQATLPTVATTQVYAFSAINTGISSVNGIQGVLNARMITRAVAGGAVMLNTYPWEWFNRFFVSQTGIANAAPTDWAQYGQGVSGSLYLYPTPDAIYTMTLDCVCYPIALVDDTTVEAIPYPWTDCVCYFAAYLALLSAQTGARTADADRMMARYEEFKTRARRYTTPTVMPYQYEQSGMRVPVIPAGVAIAKGDQ